MRLIDYVLDYMLDHLLDHVLDYMLNHILDYMIISLVTTTLYLVSTKFYFLLLYQEIKSRKSSSLT